MKNVLFVCIGNSIRSQMAEAFARKYGSDVLRAESVGLAPALFVDEMTKTVMSEVGVTMEAQISKGTDFLFPGTVWDLVVNISGHPLPPELSDYPAVAWKIEDPVSKPKEAFIEARDQIEQLVMRLVLDLRNRVSSPVATVGWGVDPPPPPSFSSGPSQSLAVSSAPPGQQSGAQARAAARQPPWMTVFGGPPPPGTNAPPTSQGQPLSRGMRRAIETGELPRTPRQNPPAKKSG